MGLTKAMAVAACGVLLLTPAAATAQTTPDRVTLVTFSGPVSIPGKTLPAGTYTFRLADSPGDRHIVQIFDRDQSTLFATLLAVPAERTEAEGDPVITFKETAANLPPAVRYWYYAGERAGNEFVYPRNQAMTIARASGESVMSVDTESNNIEDWKNGQPTRVTADAQPAASATSTTADTTTAAQPAQPQASAPPAASTTTAADTASTPAPQATASATPEPAAAAAPAPAPDRPVGTSGRAGKGELPHTASEVPAAGLVGAIALAAALALRAARRAAV